MTAFEVLSGARPWRSADALSLAAAVVGDPTPPLAGRAGEVVPHEVGVVVARALAKAPEDRFPSMEAVVAELAPWISTEAAARTDPGAAAAPTSLPAPTLGRAPPAGRRRLVLGVAASSVAVAIAIAAIAIGRSRTRPADAPALPSAAASSSAASAQGPGAHAYREAMRIWRTRSELLAVNELERAIEADPELAPAQLRYALFSFAESPTPAREHLQKAEQQRAMLDAHDAALLDAALAYMGDPPDLVRFEERVAALAAAEPSDLEALYWSALAARLRGKMTDAVAMLDRTLAIDPLFAAGASLKSDILLQESGDFEGALATADGCLARTPAAANCIGSRSAALAALGRCAEREPMARAWAAAMPKHPGALWALANTLDALGKPVESVEEAVKTSVERTRPSLRREIELWFGTRVAAAHGRFDVAERSLRDLEAFYATGRPEIGARVGVASWLAGLAIEEGLPERAGEVADALLKREGALQGADLPGWQGLTFDPMLGIAGIARHHGKLSAAAFEARRTAWLAGQEKAVAGRSGLRGALWAYGYAMPTETADDARTAVEAGGRFLVGEMPRVVDAYPDTLAHVARVWFLAGEYSRATSLLRRLTRMCDPLERPLLLVPGWLELGEALAKQGDKEGARAAFEAVLARWGNAKPRSVTAERARADLAAL